MDNQEFKEAIKLARQDAWNRAIRKAAEVASKTIVCEIEEEILRLIKRTPRSKREK